MRYPNPNRSLGDVLVHVLVALFAFRAAHVEPRVEGGSDFVGVKGVDEEGTCGGSIDAGGGAWEEEGCHGCEGL